jgi:RHS repeat-associated protein
VRHPCRRNLIAANQLTNAGFSYVPNGNLTHDGVNAYTWDRANRLLSMGGAAHKYDGLGNRVQQTVGVNITKYLLDTQPGLAVVLAATTGVNTERYVYGPRGIQARKDVSNNWHWALQDALGTVRGEVSNVVAVEGTRSVEPYGGFFGLQGSVGTPYGFTGEPLDGNGLQYHRARYYAPGFGAWTSLDLLETANRYAYVGGNPVNQRDPNGFNGIGELCTLVGVDVETGRVIIITLPCEEAEGKCVFFIGARIVILPCDLNKPRRKPHPLPDENEFPPFNPPPDLDPKCTDHCNTNFAPESTTPFAAGKIGSKENDLLCNLACYNGGEQAGLARRLSLLRQVDIELVDQALGQTSRGKFTELGARDIDGITVFNPNGKIQVRQPIGRQTRAGTLAIFVEEIAHAGQYHNQFDSVPPCKDITLYQSEEHAKQYRRAWTMQSGIAASAFGSVPTTYEGVQAELARYLADFGPDRWQANAFDACPEPPVRIVPPATPVVYRSGPIGCIDPTVTQIVRRFLI